MLKDIREQTGLLLKQYNVLKDENAKLNLQIAENVYEMTKIRSKIFKIANSEVEKP